MGLIKTLLKRVVKWVLVFIKNRIILAMLGVLLGFLAAGLTTIITDILTRLNSMWTVKIGEVENFLFVLQNKFYDAIETALQTFLDKVGTLIDVVFPTKILLILQLINFTSWVQSILARLATESGNALFDVVTTLSLPMKNTVDSIDIKINSIKLAADAYQISLNDKTTALNNLINVSLKNQVAAFNAKLQIIVKKVDDVRTAFNADFVFLDARVTDIQNQITKYNQDIPAIQNEIKAFLIANLPTDTPLTESDCTTVVFVAKNKAQDFATPITGLDIEWNKYQYIIELDTDLYPLSIAIPPLEWEFSIDVLPYYSVFDDIVSFQTTITEFPESVRSLFATNIPNILIATLEFEIKIVITLALKKMFELLKADIVTDLNTMKSDIETFGKETKAAINTKIDELHAALLKAQLDLINAIPNLLTPSITKIIEDTKTKLLEAKSEMEADIEKMFSYTPNFASIKDLIDDFPNYIPHETPNIAAAKEWTIQDVHRLLCNNFYRDERLALCAKLAVDDIQINLDDLLDLISEIATGDGK
ncbi:hypothetical protein QUF75_02005 [Desulfococcaceae bacterium HSG7]|nr:hypothetical protein [Desulfococcaceae bacterium HSG7]